MTSRLRFESGLSLDFVHGDIVHGKVSIYPGLGGLGSKLCNPWLVGEFVRVCVGIYRLSG